MCVCVCVLCCDSTLLSWRRSRMTVRTRNCLAPAYSTAVLFRYVQHSTFFTRSQALSLSLSLSLSLYREMHILLLSLHYFACVRRQCLISLYGVGHANLDFVQNASDSVLLLTSVHLTSYYYYYYIIEFFLWTYLSIFLGHLAEKCPVLSHGNGMATKRWTDGRNFLNKHSLLL